jgi:SAM-dependent methyltransferase
MTGNPVPSSNSREQYSADYGYFRARLAKRGILSYEWWASRFVVRLVRRYQKSGRLLEIGCGLGRTLRLLEDDFETYGIDVSEFAVQLARQTATRSQIMQMDASDLSAFDGTLFDVVLAAHVFEHLEQPAETLAQCAQLLKPGGILVCFVPNTDCISRRWKGDEWFGFRDAGHVSLLSPAKWLDLVTATGLRVARTFGDGLWDVPYVPVVPTFVQRPIFFLPTLIQFQLGVPFMPVRLGEGLGIVAQK